MGYQTPLSAVGVLQSPLSLLPLTLSLLGPQAALALRNLLQDSERLGSHQLRGAMFASGLWPGSLHPAHGITLKQLLETLRNALATRGQVAPEGLREDLGRALDYLEASQMRTLVEQGNGGFVCRFPVLLADRPAVDVIIRREAAGEQQEGTVWHLDLEIPLPDQHSIWIACRLGSGLNLDARLWSNDEALVTELSAGVNGLQHSLAQAGINLASCRILPGPPPVRERDVQPPGFAVDLST